MTDTAQQGVLRGGYPFGALPSPTCGAPDDRLRTVQDGLGFAATKWRRHKLQSPSRMRQRSEILGNILCVRLVIGPVDPLYAHHRRQTVMAADIEGCWKSESAAVSCCEANRSQIVD